MDTKHHITAFVDAFVRKDRRERWHFLLRNENREKAGYNSAKLLKDLDSRYMSRDDGLRTMDDHRVTGVFLSIGAEDAHIERLDHLLQGDPYQDAIFSIVPGQLAVFFFHEFEAYVLKRKV